MAETIVSVVVKTLGGNRLKTLNDGLKRTAADALKAGSATDALGKKTGELTGKLSKSGQEIRRAANGLEFFIDKAGRARKVTGQFVTTAEASAAGIEGIDNASRRAAVGVRSLEAAAAKIALVIGTVQTAVSLFNSSIERTESERRLQLIGDAYGEAGQLAEVAARSAEKFGQSQTEVNNALASTFTRLRPLGVGLADIESTFNGFNTAARLSGATAQESTNAFLQLSQALGAGRLAGDEFRSVAEQAPLILQAISKETGVAVGQLKDFAAEGNLTSDIVIKALKRIETEGADQLAESLKGPRQAFTNLGNAIENLFADIGKLGEDSLVEVVNRVTTFVNAIRKNLDVLGPLISNTIELVASLSKGFVEGFGEAVSATTEASDGIRKALAVVAVVIGDIGKLVFGLAKIIGRVVGEILKFIGNALSSLVNGVASAGNDIVKTVSNTVRNVGRLIGNLVNAFSGLPGGILKLFGIDAGEIAARPFFAVADGIDAVGASVRNYVDSVGSRANELVFGGGILPEGGDLSQSVFDRQLNKNGGGRAGGSGGRGGGARGKAVKDITKDVEALVRKANEAAQSFDTLFVVPQNPLEAEISSLNDELLKTDKELEDILLKLDELTQGDPRFDGARSQVSTLREKLSGFSEEDIKRQASRNLTKGDREGFEESIREAEALNLALKQGRTELTAVEQLAVKYGEAWEQLDPGVRQNLERLAAQKEQLDENNKAAREALEAQRQAAAELNSLYEGIGSTIKGGIIDAIGTGIDALINGTEDLDKALKQIAAGVLKQIATQLISFGLSKLPIPGFAEGGRPEPGKLAIVGEKGPELFIPDTAGTVVPNKDIGKQLTSFGAKGLLQSTDLSFFADGGRPKPGKPAIVGEKGPEIFVPDSAGTIIPNDVSNQLISFGVKGLPKSTELPFLANNGLPELGKTTIVSEKGPELFIPDSAGTVISNDVSKQLTNFDTKGLLQPTDLQFFADGGRPEVGKPAIVGEKGPELFIPDTAGTIVPNDEAFSDARNALIDTPARPANEEAEAFAVAAGALERNSQVINNRQTTTQQETSFNSFTEAMMRPGQSTVRFETVNVGDMPMVTREEALKIGAESAKAAEANVFSALRNKPSVRRSLGMV